MFRSKISVTRVPCRRCSIIRYFIIAIIFIVILSFTTKNFLQDFSFITVDFFAYLICTIGILAFIFKYFKWKKMTFLKKK